MFGEEEIQEGLNLEAEFLLWLYKKGTQDYVKGIIVTIYVSRVV